MFAAPVKHVSKTRIFACMQGDRQTLVYDASVSTETPNAMILPVPIRPGGAVEITLLDLSPYPTLFDDLARPFASLEVSRGGFGPAFGAPQPAPLPVVRVGSFEVSIVPAAYDFGRLDAKFAALSQSVSRRGKGGTSTLDVLQERYLDHAFVVYQLAPGEGSIHPFGFAFTSRYPRLFFPTLHVHDSGAPAEAEFDHALFAQRAALYQRSPVPLVEPSPYAAIPGYAPSMPPFLDPALPVDRALVRGWHPNRDSFAELTG